MQLLTAVCFFVVIGSLYNFVSEILAGSHGRFFFFIIEDGNIVIVKDVTDQSLKDLKCMSIRPCTTLRIFCSVEYVSLFHLIVM